MIAAERSGEAGRRVGAAIEQQTWGFVFGWSSRTKGNTRQCREGDRVLCDTGADDALCHA